MLKNDQRRQIAFFFLFGLLLFFCLFAPFYWRVFSCTADYSKDFLFTLSSDTKKLLRTLNESIFVEVLEPYKKEDIGHSLLNNISRMNSNVRLTYVDIYKISPEESKNLIKGSLRFSKESSANQIELLPKDLWGNQGESLHEQKISRVLKFFSQPSQKSIQRFIFLKDNGERRISDHGPNGLTELSRLLKTCGFVTLESQLSSQTVKEFLPTDVLVMTGPRQKLSSLTQSLLIDQIFTKKRNFLLFLDPISDSGFQDVGLKNIFKNWGVSYQEGILVDRENFAKTSTTLGSVFFPILSVKAPLFSNLMNLQLGQREHRVAFFSARAINIDSNSVAIPILQTSSRAYQEMDLQTLQKGINSLHGIPSVFYDAGIDKEGPLVGAATICTHDNQRIVFLGDSGFAANRVIKFYDNIPFLLSCFSWAAQNEALLNSAPYKNTLLPQISLTIQMLQILYLIRLVLMPSIPILIFCFCSYYGSKKRRIF